ncbi:hypothetical protein KAU11_11705 [Candidatus Babeliales bacterium]|nr:hypothetical protein [Candidatus Babeliales bacterium]
MPNAGTTVNRITNIKPLQQESATMITNHISKMVFLRPTIAGGIYNAGDTISIELNAFDTDYINLADSAFMFKLHIRATNSLRRSYKLDEAADPVYTFSSDTAFDRSFALRKILANGTASLIKRVRVTSGTNLVMDIEKYDIFMGTMTEMQCPKGFRDYETLSNCPDTVYPYAGPLFMTEGVDNPVSIAGDRDGSDTGNDVWLKVPLFTIFNDSGFFPNYQVGNKVIITITLNDNNAVWKAVLPPCPVPCGAASHTGGSMVYLNTNRRKNQSMIPGLWYNEEADVTGFPRVLYDTEDTTYKYHISDVLLIAHGLTVTSGGQLDAEPVIVYTDSYQMMTTPTTGAIRERHTFQFKKSSISSAWGVFTDPLGEREQNWQNPDNSMWLRGGSVGAIGWKETGDTMYDPATDDHPPREYDPSIQWWSMELGGRRFPTDEGCGMISPPDRDTNCIHMWNEYERFLGRNDITGYTFPPSITPHDEHSHGFMADCAVTPITPRNSNVRIYSTTPVERIMSTDLLKFGATYPPSLYPHPLAMLPAYWGYSNSMFGGACVRIGAEYAEDEHFYQRKFNAISATAPTGAKFIIACTFTPIDHSGSLIQGVDTERYDFMVNWQRREPINTGVFLDAGWQNSRTNKTPPANAEHLLMPLARIEERVPTFSMFFKYNIKITIQNGVITIMD